MKKLPYGISNYEELITDGYIYVDKTPYIEKLENLAEKRIMFLRPRKFGKTLFTSTLENYYDIKKQDKFKELYKDTYIGKNPTKLKNKYHILRFNFSGIDTSTGETTMKGFKEKVTIAIGGFAQKYGIDFYVNYEQTTEGILSSLIEAFKLQKPEEKIYVIIDEYDHFANELLGFNTDKFKELVSKNGKIRKWYEVLKEGTESVIDRIFITGVAPITLDSLTSGFNICSDKTRDRNYDGYIFALKAKEKMYNSNMCLYFLNEYTTYKEIPDKLVDVNIASDYSKIGKMLNLCKGENREEIIKKTVSGEGILTEIVEKFNPSMEFGETELVSMLFYLGYLTITGEKLGRAELKIPNNVMKEIYSDYFLKMIDQQAQMTIELKEYNEILEEMAIMKY